MWASSRSVRRRVAVVFVALALGLSGCSFPSDGSGAASGPTPATATAAAPAGVQDPATQPRFAKFYGQKLSWHGCGDGFQCSTLTVPVDWSAPAGATIGVAVNRLRASGAKVGSLVVNPGGPGVSGLEYSRAAQRAFGAAILDAYDIVGFDPRGVGQSAPVKCLTDRQYDQYTAEEVTPDTDAELAQAVREQKDFGAACLRNSGPVIRHVDTLSVVKDMDVLRAALGERLLYYHGASYGTYMGAWYAQTFPWRVGRMTLDGAVDPSSSSAQYISGQAEGFGRALTAFVTDCQAQGGCPLGGRVRDGLNQIGLMVDAADQAPLPTGTSRQLTQSLMVTGIADALYSNALWPRLTIALGQALDGDGSGLLALADNYLERDARGHFGQVLAANPAMFCLDVPEKRTPEQIRSAAEELDRQFPPLGGSLAWGALGCAEWPLPAVMPRVKVSAQGAAPILVIGTTGDPATPYEWAQSLAGQLSSGHLLTWKGTEHTAYHQGDRCIDENVERYLLSGIVPAGGTVCS